MILEILKLVAGLAGSLAWPLLALFALIFFRVEIRTLMARVKSAWKGVLEFEPLPQPVPHGDPTAPGPLTTLTPTAEAGNAAGGLTPRDTIFPVYRRIFDARLKALRDGMPNAMRRFSVDENELLLNVAAEAVATLHLERATRFIFGSQLDALNQLRGRNSLTRTDFRPFYESAATRWPEAYAKYTFEQWFAFLQRMQLVLVAPGGEVSLTEAGEVANQYVLDQGYGRPSY